MTHEVILLSNKTAKFILKTVGLLHSITKLTRKETPAKMSRRHIPTHTHVCDFRLIGAVHRNQLPAHELRQFKLCSLQGKFSNFMSVKAEVPVAISSLTSPL